MASTACRYAKFFQDEWLEADFFINPSPQEGSTIWKFNLKNGTIRELKQKKPRKLGEL
jgi:hypothetical protein